jgi:DnaJ-class molecular chaperone
MSLYKILEIEESSSICEIKKAYKKLILKYHPDKSRKLNIDTTSKFIEIKYAYDILSDEIKRKEYNNSFTKKNFNYKDFDYINIINNLKEIIKDEYYRKLFLIIGDKIFTTILNKNKLLNKNNFDFDLNLLDININLDYTLLEVINLKEKIINYKRITKDIFTEYILPIDLNQSYENEGEEIKINDFKFRGDLNINIIISENIYYGYKYEILNYDLYTIIKKNKIKKNGNYKLKYIDGIKYKFNINELEKEKIDLGFIIKINNFGLPYQNDNTKNINIGECMIKRGNLFLLY